MAPSQTTNGSTLTLTGTLYCHVSPDDIPEVVEKTVANGERIDRLLCQMPGSVGDTARQRIAAEGEIPFYQNQTRIMLGMNDSDQPGEH